MTAPQAFHKWIGQMPSDQLDLAALWPVQFRSFTDAVDEFDRLGLKFESGAEALFAFWFKQIQTPEPEPFTLLSQINIVVDGRSVRLDFQVVANIGFESTPLTIAVEIDGHAFHERTINQVNERDSRDRDLQRAGFTVLHFSYSALVATPHKCVEDVLRTAWPLRKKLLLDPSAPSDEPVF